jgi:hypothetical protein
VIADAAPSDAQIVSALGADEIVPRGRAVGERIRRLHPEGVAAVVDAALLGDAVLPALRDGGQIAIVRRPGERGTSTLHPERDITVRDVWVPDYTHATDNSASYERWPSRASSPCEWHRHFPQRMRPPHTAPLSAAASAAALSSPSTRTRRPLRAAILTASGAPVSGGVHLAPGWTSFRGLRLNTSLL